MKIAVVYLFYCLFYVTTDLSNCETVKEPETCQEASSVLEAVMFFPMTVCETTDSDMTDPDETWYRVFQEYLDTANDLLYPVISAIVKDSNFFDPVIFEKIKTTFDQQTQRFHPLMSSIKQTVTETSLKVRNFTKRVSDNLLPYFSELITASQPMVVLFRKLSDVTATFRTCLTAVWKQTWHTVTTSPCLCLRYMLASVLGISLPFSVYVLVREIPNAMSKSTANRPKPIKKSNKRHGKTRPSPTLPTIQQQSVTWFDTNLLKLPNLSLLNGVANVDSENRAENTLRVLHYRMCEIYDGCDCNCGGRRPSPMSSLPGYVDHFTRYTLKPEHYPMCEYYDSLTCNCGGCLRKSPLFSLQRNKMIPERFHDFTQDPEVQPGLSIEPYLQNMLPSTSGEKKGLLEMFLEGGPCVEPQQVLTKHELNGTSMLTEVSMIEDLESSIGHPQFNSSFIEDSVFTSTLSDSAFTERGSGDGRMLVITRRSPRKECGISFDAEDEVSYLEDSDDEVDDSFLDVSDINNSLSFNSGDGIYEFAVLYTLQTIYRTAKMIFQTKVPKSRDLSQEHLNDPVGDISQDTYFLLSKRKSRSKNRTHVRNRNLSALARSRSVESDRFGAGADDSLTDNDRNSDAFSYYGNVSQEVLPDGVGSWSLSSSKDGSSFLNKQDYTNLSSNNRPANQLNIVANDEENIGYNKSVDSAENVHDEDIVMIASGEVINYLNASDKILDREDKGYNAEPHGDEISFLQNHEVKFKSANTDATEIVKIQKPVDDSGMQTNAGGEALADDTVFNHDRQNQVANTDDSIKQTALLHKVIEEKSMPLTKTTTECTQDNVNTETCHLDLPKDKSKDHSEVPKTMSGVSDKSQF